MRTRTTVIMAVTLAVAAAYAWIDTPPSATRFGGDSIGGDTRAQPPPGEGITRLLNFSTAAVVRVTLHRSGVNATLTRTAEGWSGIADAKAVEEYLQNMQALAQIIVVGEDQGGPHDFGLDPPIARVTLERATEDPIDLRFGNPNPSSTGLYVQVGADGPVVLTGALALWDLDKVVRVLQSAVTPAPSIPSAKEAQS
jgi:hypothetical protein